MKERKRYPPEVYKRAFEFLKGKLEEIKNNVESTGNEGVIEGYRLESGPVVRNYPPRIGLTGSKMDYFQGKETKPNAGKVGEIVAGIAERCGLTIKPEYHSQDPEDPDNPTYLRYALHPDLEQFIGESS